MLDVSLGTFFYLFMRLFPFIIVCFFVIISIFSWDIKGFVYLVGLIITTGFFHLFNLKPATLQGLIPWLNVNHGNDELSKQKTQECVEVFPTDLPINQIVIGFTMAYLFNTLVQNGYKIGSTIGFWYNMSNPIVPFFLLVFISDLLINTSIIPFELSSKYCIGFATSMVLYTISMGFGLGWSQLISNSNNENYIFFTNYKKDDKKCSTNNTKYQCKRYVNGVIQTK